MYNVSDTMHLKSLGPFPITFLRKVSTCTQFLLKENGIISKKADVNHDICTLLAVENALSSHYMMSCPERSDNIFFWRTLSAMKGGIPTRLMSFTV